MENLHGRNPERIKLYLTRYNDRQPEVFMFPENQLLPISALQHWLYCPRQCALIHLERAWAENQYTAEGNALHRIAHDGADETRSGVRVTRGMPVRSLRLGLSGQCDVVEFHAAGAIVPIEYKRGKPKAHRADEVQLCAQAVCLEEMLGVAIRTGCIFYGQKRRRFEIVFDPALRHLLEETSAALRDMIDSRKTPLASYEAKRCNACSLVNLCEPHSLRLKRGANSWFQAHLQISLRSSYEEAP